MECLSERAIVGCQSFQPEVEEMLIHEKDTYAIRGAVFDVYREMGSGFLEAVYQECMEHELTKRKIPFHPQPQLALAYKGLALVQTYSPDLVCCGKDSRGTEGGEGTVR
jgi:hypothetical protein